MPDPSVWEDIRRAYADQNIRTCEIRKIYGITQREIDKRVIAEDWPRRLDAIQLAVARKAALAADTEATPTTTPATSCPLPATSPTPAASQKRKPTPIAYRRAIVQRLYAVIDAKLSLLERRFARDMANLETGKGKAVTSADNERDIRAIGTMIKTLEQMTDYDHGTDPGKSIGRSGTASLLSGAAAKSAALAATQLADEADRLRRELGERLQRFVDTAQGGPP